MTHRSMSSSASRLASDRACSLPRGVSGDRQDEGSASIRPLTLYALSACRVTISRSIKWRLTRPLDALNPRMPASSHRRLVRCSCPYAFYEPWHTMVSCSSTSPLSSDGTLSRALPTAETGPRERRGAPIEPRRSVSGTVCRTVKGLGSPEPPPAPPPSSSGVGAALRGSDGCVFPDRIIKRPHPDHLDGSGRRGRGLLVGGVRRVRHRLAGSALRRERRVTTAARSSGSNASRFTSRTGRTHDRRAFRRKEKQ